MAAAVRFDRVLEPRVDDVVCIHVRQHGAASAPLRDPFLAEAEFSVGRHPGFQHSEDMAQKTPIPDFLRQQVQQPLMIDRAEEIDQTGDSTACLFR